MTSVFQALIWAENKMDILITNDSKLPKDFIEVTALVRYNFHIAKFTQVKFVSHWFYSQDPAAIILLKFRAHYLSYKTSPIFFAVNLYSVCLCTNVLKHMHLGMQTQAHTHVHTLMHTYTQAHLVHTQHRHLLLYFSVL